MPLYGHELSEEIDPLTAGLAFAVNLEGREFIGRSALVAAKNKTDRPVRIGLALAGRRVPREGYALHSSPHAPREDSISRSEMPTIGHVTSGTFSPTLQKPIAMAYVQRQHAEIGGELAVDVRGTLEPARVVKLPFYSRQSTTN
jgi:aminomethyltransferase